MHLYCSIPQPRSNALVEAVQLVYCCSARLQLVTYTTTELSLLRLQGLKLKLKIRWNTPLHSRTDIGQAQESLGQKGRVGARKKKKMTQAMVAQTNIPLTMDVKRLKVCS